MNGIVKALVVLGLALAVSFPTTGCKSNPKTPVTKIPETKRNVAKPSTTNPRQNGGQGYGNNNAGRYNNNGGTLGGGLDTPEDLPPVVSGNETGIDQGNMEYFEGRPMDRDALASYTIHFDFDSSSVRPSDQANVEAIAEALKSNPNNALLIEGHCDDRGTEEYNQSLGERRANSAREAVANAGIEAGRIRTISWGEAKPVATGTDEVSYAKNRRAEFVLLLPKED